MTLSRAIYLSEALNALVTMPRHNVPRSARLHRFQLSAHEWDILRQLKPILKARSHLFVLPR